MSDQPPPDALPGPDQQFERVQTLLEMDLPSSVEARARHLADLEEAMTELADGYEQLAEDPSLRATDVRAVAALASYWEHRAHGMDVQRALLDLPEASRVSPLDVPVEQGSTTTNAGAGPAHVVATKAPGGQPAVDDGPRVLDLTALGAVRPGPHPAPGQSRLHPTQYAHRRQAEPATDVQISAGGGDLPAAWSKSTRRPRDAHTVDGSNPAPDDRKR